MTRIGPRICLKVPCIQIWAKKSERKCPKWPIVNCQALCYIGGLSINLNHLKNWNTFSSWWCGMGSCHCSQSFFTLVLDMFCFCSHIERVWLIHNRDVLLSETKLFQHEHVCQNHRMFVKQNIWQCWVLDDNACMWRTIVTLSGIFMISFQKVHNFLTNYFQRNLWPLKAYSQFVSKCLLFFCIKLWNELFILTKSQIYESLQTKFRGKVRFCNMCVLSNKMLSSLMRK